MSCEKTLKKKCFTTETGVQAEIYLIFRLSFLNNIIVPRQQIERQVTNTQQTVEAATSRSNLVWLLTLPNSAHYFSSLHSFLGWSRGRGRRSKLFLLRSVCPTDSRELFEEKEIAPLPPQLSHVYSAAAAADAVAEYLKSPPDRPRPLSGAISPLFPKLGKRCWLRACVGGGKTSDRISSREQKHQEPNFICFFRIPWKNEMCASGLRIRSLLLLPT